MALVKRVYTEMETTITAKNLNEIQDAVIALEDGLFSVDNDKSGEVITITDASTRGIRNFKLYGKTTQDGTPTPDAPVDLVSVGDGGSITVSVTGENGFQNVTISTPNGLPGIPVSSGGNYTDSNGQQWICDEIDFARGVYVQRVYQKKFTNADGINRVESGFGYRFAYAVPGLIPSNTTSRVCSLCSSLTLVQQGETYAIPNSYTVTNSDILMALTGNETIDDLANYLAEKPIEVQGVLATPVETPLTDEELSAYASLHTYKDSTTVSNDAGAYMELEYVMDAKKYIDKIAGSGGSGGGGSSARLSTVTLRASAWTGADSLYSQVVSVSGVTEYSKVDLLPSVEQLAIFHNKDVAFVTENEDGVVTVYAIGDKPTNDYTMQVSITEVTA